MKITYNKFFMLVIVFIFIRPSYLTQISILDDLFKIFTVGIFFILTLYYIAKGRISVFILLITIFYLLRIIITAIHGGYLNVLIANAIPVIGICMLADISFKDKRSMILLVSTLSLYLSIIICINLITIILYPNGLFKDGTTAAYLLGNPNHFGIKLIPAIIIIIIHSIIKNGGINNRTKFLVLLILITAFISESTTFLVSVFLLVLYLLFIYRPNISLFSNYKTLLIVYLIIFVGVTLLNLQELFGFIIEDVLGKSLTLSGRTYIWELSYRLIKDSWFIGHGAIEGGNYIWLSRGYSAHNFILQLLLESGVLGLSIFILILIYVGKMLVRVRKERLSGLISFTVFIVLIMLMLEAHNNLSLFFLLLLISTMLDKLINLSDDLRTN